MKCIVCILALGLFVNLAAGSEIAPADVLQAVAAVTGNETVRVVRSGSGFTIYGEGRSGSVMRSAGGFVIYYGGKTHRVAKSASGWTIYKGE